MSLRWLTADGALAAAAVGGLVCWGAGLPGLALLAVFFVSGSLLTSFNAARGPGSGGPEVRAAARNARQVLANGGWAAAGAMVVPWKPDIGWAVMMGSLATAQADTWATEVGAHASHPPKLITTGRSVPAGTSGGVTWLGTGAGAFGAVVLTGLGLLLGVSPSIAALATLVGVLGMLLDSVLGATLEARSWLDNDGVNLAATSAGAVATVVLTRFIGP